MELRLGRKGAAGMMSTFEKNVCIVMMMFAVLVFSLPAAEVEVAYYGKFCEAPVAAVKPAGELKDWCCVQAEGLGRDYADSGYPYDTCLWAGVMPEAKGNSCNRPGVVKFRNIRIKELLKEEK